ncbi:MAG: CHAD domain-containing protein, partial [bacterium]|nr:CHAD domain-containing protein [bacterium]
MPFSLESTESVAAGVRRIAHEQFTGVAGALTEGSGDRDDDIHSARKAMKRMRGLLRLIRGQLSTDEYRSENSACRDAARQLAGLRDATVLVATLDSLAITPDDGADAARASVRHMLEERRRAAYDDGVAERDRAVAEVVEHVRAADARVDSWPLKHAGWKMVKDGLLGIYSRGRSEFDACSWQPTTEHLHQWRK